MDYWNSKEVEMKDIIGKTFTEIKQVGDDEIHFVDSEGNKYKMYHEQNCCEGVSIEDICGDLQDLVGTPILQAEEVSNSGSGETDYDKDHDDPTRVTITGEWPADVPKPEYNPESFTWTFYKFATIKGSVTIRWYGSSNGYYSESVYFRMATGEEE